MNAEQKTVLQQLIADVLEVETTDVTPDARFVEDLEADSLRVIEILSRMEKTFGVQLPQSLLAEMTSFAAVSAILENALSQKA